MSLKLRRQNTGEVSSRQADNKTDYPSFEEHMKEVESQGQARQQNSSLNREQYYQREDEDTADQLFRLRKELIELNREKYGDELADAIIAERKVQRDIDKARLHGIASHQQMMELFDKYHEAHQKTMDAFDRR